MIRSNIEAIDTALTKYKDGVLAEGNLCKFYDFDVEEMRYFHDICFQHEAE